LGELTNAARIWPARPARSFHIPVLAGAKVFRKQTVAARKAFQLFKGAKRAPLDAKGG
jgi:hypothetical protein